MSHATYLVGDVFDRLQELPDASVDLVVTSPPFLALRSYLPADHPDKSKEIGSEPTPAAFIGVMLALSAELRRVLAPHGSIAVELGDTYAGSGGAGGDWSDSEATTKARVIGGADIGPPRRDISDGWPQAKSKTLIPELYRLALAYGINPLTGQQSPAGQWRIRNVVTWCRPNPPVGALGDKWRPATSDIVVACVSGKRYWDDIATRHEADPANKRPSLLKREGIDGRSDQIMNPLGPDGQRIIANTHGAPLLDYWEIPPGGYPGSHYAVYPPTLIIPLIKAMAPPKVCRTCGEPVRRIVDRERIIPIDDRQRIKHANGERPAAGRQDRAPEIGWEYDRQTTGFTDCGHNNYRPALVLDPFAGSGTTLMVATGHGHDAIGIDLDERNAELARERIGDLFLTVEGAA